MDREEINRINLSLDAEWVLSEMGATHIQHQGNELRCYCPVHCSDRQCSLAVNVAENICMCHNTGCPAHDGGSLLWIYSLVKGCSVQEAAEFWTGKMEQEAPALQYKERGGIDAAGRFFRNLLVSAHTFQVERSEMDTFLSVFTYDIDTMSEVRAALQAGSALLYGPCVFDFDNPFGSELTNTPFEEVETFEDGVERARKDTLHACAYLFQHDIPQDGISIFFSGRGFHLEVAPEVFGVKPSPKLHQVYREFVYFIGGVDTRKEKIVLLFSEDGRAIKKAYPAKLQSLDQNIYNADRLWRVVNTKNGKSGFWKVPLTYEEVSTRTVDEILRLGQEPRAFESVSKTFNQVDCARELLIHTWQQRKKVGPSVYTVDGEVVHVSQEFMNAVSGLKNEGSRVLIIT
ncbi:MAG: hypothetical protein HN521_12970 [Candidatus Latescibacteria bacterium]|jgi:hypothetical protein|nr:hypothetical protein [Candidatus Latescibacterota bacterium]